MINKAINLLEHTSNLSNEEMKDFEYIGKINDLRREILKEIEERGYSGITVNEEHYKKNENRLETIDMIRIASQSSYRVYAGFCLGNVIKYLSRHKYKHKEELDQIKDLKKAERYLSFLKSMLLK